MAEHKEDELDEKESQESQLPTLADMRGWNIHELRDRAKIVGIADADDIW